MKKGISLVALSVSILIIMILASVLTVSLIKNYEQARKIEFANEVNMLQIAVRNYNLNNGTYPISDNILTISNIDENIKQSQFQNEEEIDNKYSFNVIDYSKIGITSLKYGNGEDSNDKYVVSTKTGNVYYIKGLKIGNKIYYGIDTELYGLINSNDKLQKNSNDGIIFEEKIENENLKIDINIPISYTVNSITFEGENITLQSQDEVYYNYSVSVNEIGTIVIDYDINNTNKNVKYLIDDTKLQRIGNTVDRDGPVLENLSVTTDTGAYLPGETITFVATYNENIYNNVNTKISEDLFSAITLKFKFGTGEERIATTLSADDKTITYQYELQDGDEGDLTITEYIGTLYDELGNAGTINKTGSFEGNVVSAKIRQNGEISFANETVTKEYSDAMFTNTLTHTGDSLVTYASSNESVATIDASGIVTILELGTTTITATVENTENYKYAVKTASYTLTVGEKIIQIPSSPDDVTYDGASHNHGVTVPTGTEIVSASSTLSAIEPGEYIVVLKLINSNYKWSDSSTSNKNVTWEIVDRRSAGSISYATTSVSKTYGDAQFTNTLTHIGDATITYASSNTNVATVNSSGIITIAGTGSTTITATVVDTLNYKYATKTASYTLTVSKKSITRPSSPSAQNYDGTAKTYNVTTPTGTTRTSNSTVSATAPGTYYVYYTINDTNNFEWDNGTTAQLTVSWQIVDNRASGSISYSTTSVSKNTLSAKFTNTLTKTGNGSVSYASSNTNVATVNSSTGEVTLKAAGSTTITATVSDSTTYKYATKTASYTLTVVQGYSASSINSMTDTQKQGIIGKSVNLTSTNGWNDWRIFSADGTNIMLITGDYIELSYLPSNHGFTTSGDYKVWDPTSRDDLLTKLTTASIFNGFKDSAGKVSDARIPTIQDFAKSYNAVTHGGTMAASSYSLIQKVYYKDNGVNGGYNVGPNRSYTATSNETVSAYSNTASYFPVSETNYGNLWVINDDKKANGYWLASPSSNRSDAMLYVRYDGSVDYMICYPYNGPYIGLRTVVVLNSNVTLTWNSATNKYDIN